MSLVKEVYQRSSPKSMDFHPLRPTYLLVGTDIGEVSLWKLVSRNGISGITVSFEVWDVKSSACKEFVLSMKEDPSISVNCIRWSSDGVYFGVAFSKCVVHLYYYHGGLHIARHGEILAHPGSVNDLLFTFIKNRHMVLTCGDDGCIKGWDQSSGTIVFSFEGDAEKPVYCIRPCIQNNTLYILSTSSDGNIRLWSHDTASSVIIHKTGNSSVAMAFSNDGERLFSCGKNEDSTLSLFEWSGNGLVHRTYEGLTVCASNIVQVETAIDRILAVGNDHQVKFWLMDEPDLLMSYDAEGLPATPIIRFNKSGSLLAVSTSDNRIRVLATAQDRKLLRSRRKF